MLRQEDLYLQSELLRIFLTFPLASVSSNNPHDFSSRKPAEFR
jgi:hypothetical protein